jgi:hypothetical protein
MRIRVLGAGIYGCHIATALLEDDHDVEVHDIAGEIFAGASGGIPARIHQGQHYPRSRATRAACQEHSSEFMARYGKLTAGIPVNLYCIAKNDSLVDFEQYRRTLAGEIEFITVYDPAEFGLQNVEGALLTGERHIVTRKAKRHFELALAGCLVFDSDGGTDDYDWTVDCTFAAREAANIDRYEPCLTVLMRGPTDRAVTIMDGPFGSLYVWDEDEGLNSLTSASLTPFSKTCRSWAEAKAILDSQDNASLQARATAMLGQMAEFWPQVQERYWIVDYRLAIRAMPKSAADTRLVDVVKDDRTIRVRAGKIDAVIQAEQIVKDMIA